VKEKMWYTIELKIATVKDSMQYGSNVRRISILRGIPEQTVYSWKKMVLNAVKRAFNGAVINVSRGNTGPLTSKDEAWAVALAPRTTQFWDLDMDSKLKLFKAAWQYPATIDSVAKDFKVGVRVVEDCLLVGTDAVHKCFKDVNYGPVSVKNSDTVSYVVPAKNSDTVSYVVPEVEKCRTISNEDYLKLMELTTRADCLAFKMLLKAKQSADTKTSSIIHEAGTEVLVLSQTMWIVLSALKR